MTVRADQRKERLTVSLTRRARDFVRTQAAVTGTDQSAVVEDALRSLERERRREITRQALLANWQEDERIATEWEALDDPLPLEDFSDWPGWERE